MTEPVSTLFQIGAFRLAQHAMNHMRAIHPEFFEGVDDDDLDDVEAEPGDMLIALKSGPSDG